MTEIHCRQQGFKQSFLAMLLQKLTAGHTSAVDGYCPRIMAPCIRRDLRRSEPGSEGANLVMPLTGSRFSGSYTASGSPLELAYHVLMPRGDSST
jgi:hypothetical protein